MYCGDCSEATSEALEVFSKISGVYKYSYEVRVIYTIFKLEELFFNSRLLVFKLLTLEVSYWIDE